MKDNSLLLDLKPANMLVTKDGVVKISDFGVSVQMVNIESMRTSCVGTPHYSAPEVNFPFFKSCINPVGHKR